MNESLIDVVVIVGYLTAIVVLGCWVGYKKSKSHQAQDYFLAGKSLKWPMIGMALFATNISCLHLVSLAQAGFTDGLLMGNFEWMAAFCLLLLGLFFAPFYLRSKVATLPDFLEKRYCRECRDWLAILAVISAIGIHIGFSLSTGALVLQGMFGINIWVSIICLAVLTGAYTIVGGLMAVVLTETIQTVVLLVGAIIITIAAFLRVGGWGGMVEVLQSPHEQQMLSMLWPHGSKMPWYAIMLGYPVLGIWYWCADQTIVQRVLGAKDENHARIGAIFAGFIKILPLFLFVLPGLMFYAIIKKNLLPGVEVTDSKEVYALMIQNLLPVGLTGVMAAALIAALMSTVSGALNSIATLVSYDIYKRFRPETSDSKLVTIGRVAAAIAMCIAIGLVPLLNMYSSIFAGINDIIAHIAPPVTTVFILGIFWPKASARSAKWTLWVGSLLGFGCYFTKVFQMGCGIESFFTQTNFMLMCFYLFVVCLALQIVLTLAFPKLANEDPEKLHWKSPLDPLREKGWTGIGNYKFLGGLLMVTMIILYWIFR